MCTEGSLLVCTGGEGTVTTETEKITLGRGESLTSPRRTAAPPGTALGEVAQAYVPPSRALRSRLVSVVQYVGGRGQVSVRVLSPMVCRGASTDRHAVDRTAPIDLFGTPCLFFGVRAPQRPGPGSRNRWTARVVQAGMNLPRVLLACGLGGVLALGAVACADAPGSTRQSTSSTNPQAQAQSQSLADVPTTKDNITATRKFSRWLLHAVPLPPSAREWRHSPTSHYRRASVGIGPSDSAFTRTTWWTVPLTGSAFETWLRAHAPRGLTPEEGSGGSVQSEGVWERDLDFQAPGTAAHTRGWVNFAFMPQAGGLVVRVDTYAGARFARTLLVPATVTAVTIRRTKRSTGPRPRPRTTTRTITDPGSVADLVGLVNGLPGAMTQAFVTSCPAALEELSYRLTFAAPDHTYVADLPTTMCWPEVRLSSDGTPVDPPLDPGQGFTRTVDRFLR